MAGCPDRPDPELLFPSALTGKFDSELIFDLLEGAKSPHSVYSLRPITGKIVFNSRHGLARLTANRSTFSSQERTVTGRERNRLGSPRIMRIKELASPLWLSFAAASLVA